MAMVGAFSHSKQTDTDTVNLALLGSSMVILMRVYRPISPTCNGVGCRWGLPQPLHLLLDQLVVFVQATALVAHLSIPQLP